MKVHEKHEELECLTCYYKCENKDVYKEHIGLHQNKPKAQCVFCDKLFSLVSIMRQHIRVFHVSY